MVPRISKRGYSFVGAAKYYLHDKKADTDERVAWTYTHNIPTDNPEKAFGWMAYTAMNAERLKQNADVSKVGRKSSAGAVYSYSLAWHPEQSPERETMQDAAMEVLEHLGLVEHEAVFVAHTDTQHPHVHVVCNLVHPEHGKTASPSYDYLTASRWAENLEKEEGQIRCEQRVINNEKRRRLEFQSESTLVKHREKRLENTLVIQELYKQSDTGKAFQAALQDAGYTLAKGDRRGFVLVNEQGKITSLSRQLKGQRARDIKARLKNVLDIPLASQIAEERQQLETTQKNTSNDGVQKTPNQQQSVKPSNANLDENDAFLKRLDAVRSWEQKTEQQKQALLEKQENQYQRGELIEKIQTLEKQLFSTKKGLSKNSKKKKEELEYLEALRMNLANMDSRIKEQHDALKNKALESKPRTEPENTIKDEKQKRIDYIKQQQDKKHSKRRGKGPKL